MVLDRPPAVPDGFWVHPSIVAAVAARDMGRLLVAYREHPHHGRRISQEQLAGWLGTSQAQLSRYERGTSQLRRLDRLASFAERLGVPTALLWFQAQPLESEPPTLPACAVGPWHADGIVETIGQTTARPGRLTDRAFLVGAELAKTAGTMSWDSGLHRQAQRYYVLSVQMAKAAGEDSFAAVALAALARQMLDLGHAGDGLDAIQLALYGTRRTATPGLRAMLHTREAWAYACQGDSQGFHRAIGMAQESFAERHPADEPRWLRGFDAAELAGVIGARFRDLARHQPKQAKYAQHHISRALELRDPARTRNRAFDGIGLARAHLISGDPEHSCELIREALPSAANWTHGRVGEKLHDFFVESEPYDDVGAVRETRDQLRDLLPA